jgi:hypothetical protein
MAEPKRLRPHQIDAYDTMVRHFTSGAPITTPRKGASTTNGELGRVAILGLPTGAGKTTTAWAVFTHLLKVSKTFDRVVVLAPLNIICDGWENTGVLSKYIIMTDDHVDTAKLLFKGNDPSELGIQKVLVSTHAGATSSEKIMASFKKHKGDHAMMSRTLLVIDEAHHLKDSAEDEDFKANSKLRNIVVSCVEAGASLMCLSATPFRSDGGDILPKEWGNVRMHSLSLQEYASYYLDPNNCNGMAYFVPGLDGKSEKDTVHPPCPQKWGVKFHRNILLDAFPHEDRGWWEGYLNPDGATDQEKQMRRMAYRWHVLNYAKTIFIVPMGKGEGGTQYNAEYLKTALIELCAHTNLLGKLPDWCHGEGSRIVIGVGDDGGKSDLSDAMEAEREVLKTPNPKYTASTVDALILYGRGKEGMDWPFCSAVIGAMPRTFPAVGVTIQRLGRALRSKYHMDFTDITSHGEQDIEMLRDYASLEYVLPIFADHGGESKSKKDPERVAIAQLALYLGDPILAHSVIPSSHPPSITGGASRNAAPVKSTNRKPLKSTRPPTAAEAVATFNKVKEEGLADNLDNPLILASAMNALGGDYPSLESFRASLGDGKGPEDTPHDVTSASPHVSPLHQSHGDTPRSMEQNPRQDLGILDLYFDMIDALIREKLMQDPEFYVRCVDDLSNTVSYIIKDVTGAKEIEDLTLKCMQLELKFNAFLSNGDFNANGGISMVYIQMSGHAPCNDAKNFMDWVRANPIRQFNIPYIYTNPDTGAEIRGKISMNYRNWRSCMQAYLGKPPDSESLGGVYGMDLPSSDEQERLVLEEIQKWLDVKHKP